MYKHQLEVLQGDKELCVGTPHTSLINCLHLINNNTLPALSFYSTTATSIIKRRVGKILAVVMAVPPKFAGQVISSGSFSTTVHTVELCTGPSHCPKSGDSLTELSRPRLCLPGTVQLSSYDSYRGRLIHHSSSPPRCGRRCTVPSSPSCRRSTPPRSASSLGSRFSPGTRPRLSCTKQQLRFCR